MNAIADAIQRGILVVLKCAGCGDTWKAQSGTIPTTCCDCGGRLEQVR